MRITTKILITTLPLVVLGLLGLGWMTSLLSERALNQLAERWLNTKLLSAIQIAEGKFELLARYELQDIPANVKKAQDATAKAMSSIQIGQYGFIIVVNASGSIVLSPDQSQIGMDVSSEPWFRAIEDKKKGCGTLIHKGVPYLTVQQYFEPWRWHVLACAQQREVYGEVDHMRNYVLAAAVLSAVVVALFLFFVIRRIISPLHMLAREAKRIGEGDLETTISLASRDEIGTLAEAFNIMTGQLRALIVSLEQGMEELNRSNQALQASEHRFRSLIDTMNEGLVEMDANWSMTFVNNRFTEMTGFSADQLTGRLFHDLVSEESKAKAQEEFARRGKRKTRGYELELVRADKEKIFVLCSPKPSYDSEGNYIGGLGVVSDITARKRAEEKRIDSEQRLRLTLEATQIGIFDWDVEHDSWYASLEYYTMLGYEPKEGLGDRKEWLERVHPDDRGHVEAKIRDVLAGNSSADQPCEYGYEARIRHADGTYRWQHVKGYGVKRDQEGRVTRMLGIRMDITERKAAEEALRLLNTELDRRVLERTAQLEAANKEMHAFTYTVSHDLRAPLRHIDGFLGLLQKKAETALDEQGRQYMDAISDAAQKMGLLIDDLLSFSRMGRHAMSFQPVDLGTLLRDVIRELEPDAAGRTIQWRIGDLPAVGGDASLLRMVLVNLISNALKFTRPRQQARIEIGSLPGPDSEVVIFVRDNGVGFDMTYVDKLFGVFQRLHRMEEFEGTGIGLANVRRIIARHGGRTWAQGEPDHGATFFFSLPPTLQGGRG